MRDWKQFVRRKLPPLGLSGAREAEIAEELALQLEQSCSDAIARGASRSEAEARAAAQIRDWRALAAEIRRAETPLAAAAAERMPEGFHFEAQEIRLRKTRGGNAMADFLQDLRYAMRMLRKSPGLTAVIILTLALGIGANSAIFSVLNSVLLRPLPYRDAKRLVWVGDYLPNQRQSGVFDVDYFAWRRHCTSFQEMTAYMPGAEYTLTGSGEAERIIATRATWTYLRTLGVAPQIGRDISAEEDIPHGPRVALLSNSLWRRRFSADAGVAGRTIVLDGNLYTIIGVLPAGFEFPESRRSDLLVPLGIADLEVSANRPIMFVRIIARLKPGATPEAAAAEVDTVAHPFHETFPGGFGKLFEGSQAQVVFLRDRLVGDTRKSLLLLLGAVGFVLLIACANVASLQLARAAAREKEIAVRGAMGAGRWRLARQLFTETTLTGLAGGAAGLLLGIWIVSLVRHYGPHNIPHLDVAYLDGRVVLFTIAVSLFTGILFGLAPVASAFRLSLNDSLKQGGAQGSAGRKVVRPQQALMTLELAMALVLLIGAGLLARSFVRLVSIPQGFDSHGVLTGQIALPASKYIKGDQQRAFYSELMERLQALPGVTSAGAGAALPLGGMVVGTIIQIEGRPGVLERIMDPRSGTAVDMVTGGSFAALRIPLKAGRFLDQRDAANAIQAAVVNEAFVRRYFPNEDPLGHRFQTAGNTSWRTIVGVVGDTRQMGLATEVMPEVFLSLYQSPYPDMALAIRTDADPSALVPAIRTAVAAIDKDVPLYGVETLDETLAAQVASQRFNMALLGAFAALALLLAAVGIYGVMAYAVGQRTQEIGIRMALGALPENVMRMVLAQGARLAVFGVVLGLGAGIALTRLLRTLLFEVKPGDPATFAIGAAILFAAAIAACWIPARRATRVDPLVALRYE
ncbi:MAG TPA: ABC transporter permease [Candidatus Acidoferrum sp.]|nr:ABC transporter permease [Candidatus Acidoferrum sp.]